MDRGCREKKLVQELPDAEGLFRFDFLAFVFTALFHWMGGGGGHVQREEEGDNKYRYFRHSSFLLLLE